MQVESLIGQTLVCTETGKTFVGEIVDGFTTNYARNAEGQIFSDEGVQIREERELLDRSKPFWGYVSSDGKRFTGWKGNLLGHITASSQVRSWRRSRWGDLWAYTILNVHGAMWFGRGAGAGICLKIRPCKACPRT